MLWSLLITEQLGGRLPSSPINRSGLVHSVSVGVYVSVTSMIKDMVVNLRLVSGVYRTNDGVC